MRVARSSLVETVLEVDKVGVNEIMRTAASGPLREIMEYEEDPIVSSDVIGNSHSSIYDAASTMVLGENMVKTVAWFDNGWGYAHRVVDLIKRFAAMEEGR